MPTTVTASNGTVYPLWQLGDLTTPEPEETIRYATIDNDLGDGYRMGILCGASAGTRSWKLTAPTLAHADVLAAAVTDPTGATVSREQYLRNLFVYNKTIGPFVYLNASSNTYHFVDFGDVGLTMKRMKVKIFTVGITLIERRIAGVTLPSP